MCRLRRLIEIISEGNTIILHFAFLILHFERQLDKLKFEDVHSNNESGGPNGASKLAGQSGTRCQRALPAKLKFVPHRETPDGSSIRGEIMG